MMKKICIVFHSPDRFNGATRSLLDLIETWVKSNRLNIICILPRNGTAVELLHSWGIKTYLFNYHDVRYYSTTPLKEKLIRNTARRFRMFKEFAVDVRRARKQLLSENIDVIYSNTGAIFFGAWLSELLNVPHVWHIREMGEEDQNAHMLCGMNYFIKLLNKSKLIIAISECVKNKYSKYVGKNTKIIRMYNDVSAANVDYSKRSLHCPMKLLIVGSIIEGKGHEQVIRSIRVLIDKSIPVELFVAGKASGDYYNKMLSLVEQLQIQKYVHFLGHVANMKELKREMNVEVVASKCEAFGRITVEAMLSGLPLVGANTGCTKELISDNVNGLLYRWGDVDDLSQKIEYVFNNYNSVNELAKVAFEYAKQFTQGNTANQIESLLLDL